ncbi:MAG: AAA family ATPase [Alphaproteobacteria bacterium]|nr:AAA family ATPase [Alphaproteobacteria bacterium]
MIEKVRIDRVGPIDKVDLTLGRLTVITGANGTGKTSVLRALESALGESDLPADAQTVVIKGTRRRGWKAGQPIEGPGPWPMPVPLRLQAADLEGPSPLSSGPTLLDPLGRGLAGAVARGLLADPTLHDRLVADLGEIAPGLRRIRAVPAEGGSLRLRLDFERAADVPQDRLGAGTLLALGLLTVLHAQPRDHGALLLVDDVETSLHPDAQRALVQRLLTAPDDVQIVLTTHSSHVVDAAGPENTWVLGRNAEGRTTALLI